MPERREVRAGGRRTNSMTEFDVSPGVHRIEHAFTNCYLVVENDEVTLVDAAYSGTWAMVEAALAALSLPVQSVRALVLTHGHFDHVGFARFVQTRLRIPVWVHGDDRWLAANPYRYRPQRNRLLYPFGHLRSVPVLAAMVRAGAAKVRGVEADREFGHDQVLDVPGRLRVVHVPGHTDGECCFVLDDRSTILTGDALVTLDPYTGRTGPRLVAPAATADTEVARSSLSRLAGLSTEVVLPGHGAPWMDGIANAVDRAQAGRDG